MLLNTNMEDWNSKTRASTTVTRNADGELSDSAAPIRVQAEYIEYKENADGETRTRAHHGATFLFAVDDQIAKLDRLSDPKGEDSHSSSLGFGFLRCVAAAEQAARNIHDIESVASTEKTLHNHLEYGREAVESKTVTHFEDAPAHQHQSGSAQ